MVLGAIPVARDTAAIPPWPAARASLAANRRRPRSSRCGDNNANRERIRAGSTIPPNYGTMIPTGIPQSRPILLILYRPLDVKPQRQSEFLTNAALTVKTAA